MNNVMIGNKIQRSQRNVGKKLESKNTVEYRDANIKDKAQRI